MAGNNNVHDFICYGELLWDLLPSGAKPGGAPMNVAFHLKKLGHNPAVITRVGPDERGKEIVSILRDKNITTDFVQTDPQLPTGIVHAMPNEHHEMTYDIVAPAAWDNIEWDNAFSRIFDASNYLVFGSLICRNNRSRDTLFQLIEMASNKVLDINLRPPHYNRELLTELLTKADVVKLNRDELDLVSRWNSDVSGDEDQVENVQDTFKIPNIIVTLGGKGAMMNIEGKFFRHPGYNIVVEDTVGSGDAFLAALLSGLIKNKPAGECLSFACAIGALVTSKKGAWPDYDISETKLLKEHNT